MVWYTPLQCLPWQNVEGPPYGYRPSLGAGIAFCVLFGLSAAGHIFSAVRTRKWWQLVFAVGAIGEVIGWAGRSWSSQCPYMTMPYMVQISSLILAPAFFTAGTYVILGRLIKNFGPGVSPIGPNWYLYIFCGLDVVSMVIQAIGGTMASIAYGQTPPGDTSQGTHIMVAGIVFQMGSIAIFTALFVVVIIRTMHAHIHTLEDRKIKLLLGATALSVTMVVVRSIYRTIEMLQGWGGYLISHEIFFIVLDGILMILAVTVFNFISPGWADEREEREVSSSIQTPDGDESEMGIERK